MRARDVIRVPTTLALAFAADAFCLFFSLKPISAQHSQAAKKHASEIQPWRHRQRRTPAVSRAPQAWRRCQTAADLPFLYRLKSSSLSSFFFFLLISLSPFTAHTMARVLIASSPDFVLKDALQMALAVDDEEFDESQNPQGAWPPAGDSQRQSEGLSSVEPPPEAGETGGGQVSSPHFS